jgi:hypothetical protein
MVVVCKYLIPKGYAAIALFPFILISDAKYVADYTLINHEKIHLRQQAELLILPFFVWYALEYLYRMIKFRDHHKAYRSISFEAEAYSFEADYNYLSRRHGYAFTKFLQY